LVTVAVKEMLTAAAAANMGFQYFISLPLHLSVQAIALLQVPVGKP
jgi:hypothetical protein